jgi:hypothetical protein
MNLINRLNVKRFTSKLLKELRPEITRISPSFLEKVEKQVKLTVKDLIINHKSKDKTLK